MTTLANTLLLTLAASFELSLGFANASPGDLYAVNGVGLNASNIVKFSSSGTESAFVSGGDSIAIAFDRLGNLYAAQGFGSNIVRVAPNGTQSTFASGISGVALAFDSAGNLFVCVPGNHEILNLASDG